MRCKDGHKCGLLCACLCVYVHPSRMNVRRVLLQGSAPRVSANVSRMAFGELTHRASSRSDGTVY